MNCLPECTLDREPLTDELVWLFVSEGCSAEEVATYGKIPLSAAYAWIAHATRQFAHEPRRETLRIEREA